MGYITKSNLSGCCDFGVQMGEYACMFAISKKIGLEPIFIKEQHVNCQFQFHLSTPFTFQPKIYSSVEINFGTFIPLKNGYEFISELTSDNNYDIIGDAGFYDVYDGIRESIIDLYTFKPEILTFCQNYISKNIQKDEITIGIHFRRGDYLAVSGLNLSLNYYYEAIKYFQEKFKNKKIKYLIFSNDIEWVKNNLNLNNCLYVEGFDRFHDMCLMTLCDHMIIANSTFSYWGAYLNKNKNKNIICPYAWGNPRIDGIYFPKDWIPLKVY